MIYQGSPVLWFEGYDLPNPPVREHFYIGAIERGAFRWAAACSCGWTGKRVWTQSGAIMDHSDHVIWWSQR